MKNTSYLIRSVNKENLIEMRFIAEKDSQIPLEYDPLFIFNESSIDSRLEFYSKLKEDDFFEVVLINDLIIGFHIVMKISYPANLFSGNIITLWVHPDYRGKGIAKELKRRANGWAKSHNLYQIQTSVSKNNTRMLKINQLDGYEEVSVNLRKIL